MMQAFGFSCSILARCSPHQDYQANADLEILQPFSEVPFSSHSIAVAKFMMQEMVPCTGYTKAEGEIK